MKLQEAIAFMKANKISNIIWLWHDCPLEEAAQLSHGGDEDYVVLYDSSKYMAEYVVDRLVACDEYTMDIDGEPDFKLSVTAHA